jgi:hypothetical protein
LLFFHVDSIRKKDIKFYLQSTDHHHFKGAALEIAFVQTKILPDFSGKKIVSTMYLISWRRTTFKCLKVAYVRGLLRNIIK